MLAVRAFLIQFELNVMGNGGGAAYLALIRATSIIRTDSKSQVLKS